MRGIVWMGEQAEIRNDVEVRAPNHGEVWVRIVAAGVCHSDVSVMDGTIPWPAPSLMGHEGAGIVEAIGPGVTRVKKGDHVVVATVANCGACKWCNIGKPTWCRASIANRTEPFTVNGVAAGNFAATSSFAEITVIKEIQAVPIPDDVPLTSACLIACGVVTGLGSVFNLADVKPGQTAAVFGAGGVGLSAIQALRIKQASRIIVIDANPAKKEIALQLGGTDFIDAREVDDVSAAVRDLLPHSREMPRGPFGAGGVDWSFECVGHPKVLETAIDITDWGGTTVVVGVPGPDARVSVPITHLTQVDRRIIGSRAGAVRAQHDIPMIVDLYKRGQFDLDAMVSQTYPMDDFFTVVHDMHEGKLARGVLVF